MAKTTNTNRGNSSHSGAAVAAGSLGRKMSSSHDTTIVQDRDATRRLQPARVDAFHRRIPLEDRRTTLYSCFKLAFSAFSANDRGSRQRDNVVQSQNQRFLLYAIQGYKEVQGATVSNISLLSAVAALDAVLNAGRVSPCYKLYTRLRLVGATRKSWWFSRFGSRR